MTWFMTLFVLLSVYSAVGANTPQDLNITELLKTTVQDAIHGLGKEFEGFKTHLNVIETRFTTLEQKAASGDSRCLVRNIVEDVRTSNYAVAEHELIELDNDDLIPTIVHQLYAGSSANVANILKFAKSLKSSETNFLVLSALHEEVGSSGNNDPLQLIVLANELERLLSVETKEEVQVLVQNIVQEIKTAAIRKFKAAMFADTFQNNDEVKTLTTALFDFRLDVAKEVMEEVVDKVFGVVAAETIINNISSTKYIELIITGLTAMFKRFNFTGSLNKDVIVRLATNLEKLQQRVDYGYLFKDEVDELIRQLPTCVRNLFFYKNVCLWNKGMNMYIYAADTSLKLDDDRRSVFTYAGDPKPGAYWAVERHGSEVFFRNVDYETEYLYPKADAENGNRYVLTWLPGKNKNPQSAWTVELYGDYCYLKSAKFREYMVAAPTDSLVFTSTTRKGVTSSDKYLWQLRNCSRT